MTTVVVPDASGEAFMDIGIPLVIIVAIMFVVTFAAAKTLSRRQIDTEKGEGGFERCSRCGAQKPVGQSCANCRTLWALGASLSDTGLS